MKSEWNLVRLGDIADVQSGGTPLVSNPDFWNGDIAWYSSGELNVKYTCTPDRYISQLGIDNSNAKLFPKGSLLIGMYDTAALKMSILDRDAAFNQAIAGVRPNTQIDLSFIQYAIDSHREYILGQRRGVRQKNLSLAKIRDIELWLPPLSEQQRIVAIIDEAFEAIAVARTNTEQNRQNARALFESHLQSVFSQRGEGWVETTIGNHVDFLAGFAFKSTQYTESSDGIRLIRGDNIVQGQLRWDGVKRLPLVSAENYAQFSFEENDIVLAMDRPLVAAGLKVACITKNDLPSLQVQRTARLRVKPSLHWKYLFHLIRSSGYVAYLLDGQTGLGVPHISGKQILSFEFSIPPLSEQLHIVQRLDALSDETQRLESLYQRKIAALDELKQSLLQQAFSGNL